MHVMRQPMELAVEQGAITAEEAAAFERAVGDAVDAGEAFFSVTMFAVLGRR
jgi:hypothetical protein